MKALDLFCGAGGVSTGLQRAGFDVTGVDINPQPNHRGGTFIQADAMEFPLDGYDFIWASPPCQRYSIVTKNGPLRYKTGSVKRDMNDYPDLVPPIRDRLEQTGKPYVIENVPGAPLQNAMELRGDMFGLKVIRRRLFESNVFLMAPPKKKLVGTVGKGDWVCVCGKSGGVKGGTSRIADWRAAMGIDWMARNEITQAIPPAYAEFIGHQILACLLSMEKSA